MRRRAALALVAVLCVGGGSLHATAPPRVPFDTIRKELDDAESAPSLRAARKHLRRATVKLPPAPPRGQSSQDAAFTPLHRSLRKAIAARSPKAQQESVRRAQAQVESLARALSVPGGDSGIRARAAGKLQEVLARREFHHNDARTRVMAWIAARVVRALNWLADRLQLSFDGGADLIRVLAYVIGFAAICVAVYLVVIALSSFLQRTRAKAAEELRAPDRDAELSPRRTREALLQESRQRAAAGEFRRALRSLYQALILTLHLSRLLDYDANRTNREYVAAIHAGGNAMLTTAFAQATSLFERKWYGCQPTEQADVERMAEFVRVAETRSLR